MLEREMGRTAAISVRVGPELKAGIERLAEADHRTVAQYVERVLIEHLKNSEHVAAASSSTVPKAGKK